MGSANFIFGKEFVAFGFLRRNLDASALNENRFDRPAQFGGRGARIGVALIGARTQHFVGEAKVRIMNYGKAVTWPSLLNSTFILLT
jgi:hypothetical protein